MDPHKGAHNAGLVSWAINFLLPKKPKKPKENESKMLYYAKYLGWNIGNDSYTVTTTGTWTASGNINAGTGDLTISANRIELNTGFTSNGTVDLSATVVSYGIDQTLTSTQAANVEVQSGNELTIDGDLTVGINDGTTDLVNAGTVTVNTGQTLSAGSISNTGTLALGTGSTLQGTGNTLNNAGALNVADGGTVTDAGAINNLAAGTITFAGNGSIDADDDNDSGGVDIITNDGAIVIAGAGSTVAVGTDALTNQGTGTIAVLEVFPKHF